MQHSNKQASSWFGFSTLSTNNGSSRSCTFSRSQKSWLILLLYSPTTNQYKLIWRDELASLHSSAWESTKHPPIEEEEAWMVSQNYLILHSSEGSRIVLVVNWHPLKADNASTNREEGGEGNFCCHLSFSPLKPFMCTTDAIRRSGWPWNPLITKIPPRDWLGHVLQY